MGTVIKVTPLQSIFAHSVTMTRAFLTAGLAMVMKDSKDRASLATGLAIAMKVSRNRASNYSITSLVTE